LFFAETIGTVPAGFDLTGFDPIGTDSADSLLELLAMGNDLTCNNSIDSDSTSSDQRGFFLSVQELQAMLLPVLILAVLTFLNGYPLSVGTPKWVTS
jgi:hypothetical protein